MCVFECVSEQVHMCVWGFMSQGQMQACHADSLHHRGLMWRDSSCQNTGAAVSSSKGQMGEKKPYKDTHSHLDDSVPMHWSAMNAWKDTGNPVLYHTQKRKRKWDLHQSIKGRAKAGESPVEMAAADNATPVIITRGLLSLFSTGKHIHMMCLTEQRSSVSHRGHIRIFSECSQWGLFEHSYDKRLVFFLRFSYHLM